MQVGAAAKATGARRSSYGYCGSAVDGVPSGRAAAAGYALKAASASLSARKMW
jgi:hypothetical protein